MFLIAFSLFLKKMSSLRKINLCHWQKNTLIYIYGSCHVILCHVDWGTSGDGSVVQPALLKNIDICTHVVHTCFTASASHIQKSFYLEKNKKIQLNSNWSSAWVFGKPTFEKHFLYLFEILIIDQKRPDFRGNQWLSALFFFFFWT